MTTRDRELADVRAWACDVLADPNAVILDTETTDLDGYIVQIAVIDATGAVLLDTLVNPCAAISPEAQAVHGISAEMVNDAPTFAEIEPHLREVLAGRRVVIYNAVFDVGILRNEILRLYGLDNAPSGRLTGDTWFAYARWECAMKQYAVHVGQPGRYGQGYRWQGLQGGDHSAVGDCRAALEVVRKMAGQ